MWSVDEVEIHFAKICFIDSKICQFPNQNQNPGTHLVQIHMKHCYALYDLNTEQKFNLTFQRSIPSLSIARRH